MDTFEAHGIIGVNYSKQDEQHLLCPVCSHTRKKSKDKCLGVNVGKSLWGCNHCGWSGKLITEPTYKVQPKIYSLPEVIVSPLSNKAILWLEKDRGINRQTMSEFKLFSTTKYFHAKAELKAGEISCIGFPYFRNEIIVNCKYRDGKKRFTFEPGAELIAYNENSILGSLEIVIVEGELDVLSVWQSGYKGVISPPNGANLNRNNLDWLDRIYDNFEKVTKIIIAVDNDQAGESLKTDLIRRFGSERVWLAEWPEGCKDANDVLVKYGESLVKKCLSEAKQVPLEGIVDYEKIGNSVLNFYQNGLPQGLSTQWSKFSELFKIIRGEFMVVTGIPSHGKSVWSENYMMQLSRLHDWKFGVCVFESDPDVMTLNLIQVLIKKKFFGSQRLSEIEMQYALSFIKNHFYFFDVGESSNTLDNILQKGEELVRRYGIDTLYIDPWSYVEKDKGRMSDAEFFEAQLPKIKRFRIKNNCGVLLVAHPRKMDRDKTTNKLRVPEPYDIGGSNQWFGAPDKIISVYADYTDDGKIANHSVYIHKQKKWWLGNKGVVEFKMLEHGEFIELHEYNQRDMNPAPDFKQRQANDDTMKFKTIEEDEQESEYSAGVRNSMDDPPAPF